MQKPKTAPGAQTAQRGLCFDLGAKPGQLFVPSDDIKVQVWDPFAPVWGPVVKWGISSQFDEVTYAQMLDDAVARNLRIYMDQDHRTARFFTEPDIPALAFYCALQVNHEGKLWRKENLAGHTCADAVPLDPAQQPEGLAGFRCQVTPDGRRLLPNYQALSIHFDPNSEDWRGRPIGQSLICVAAVNGPHLPMAQPQGGQFSSRKVFDMKVKRFYVLAKGDAEGGSDAPEQKDLSVEMQELAACLGLPEGSSPEAVIGAALGIIKAGKPDGDEPLEGEQDGQAMDDMPGMADGMKKLDGMPDEMKGYAKKALFRFARPRRVLAIFAKELGAGSPSPKAVLKALLAYKAKSVDSGEYAKVNGRLEALEKERESEKALARKTAITKALDSAKEQGLINEKKRDELFAQAEKYKAPVEDVVGWLPDPATATFTSGGAPSGKKPGAGAPNASERVVNANQAQAIEDFRNQYQKETGKRLKHEMAGKIVGDFFRRGAPVDYAQAKSSADRLPADAFLPKGGK